MSASGGSTNGLTLRTTLSLFRRTSWRHWTRDWRSTLLLLFIVATGVACYLSIRMANRAAVASFGGFTEAVQGQSDWIIESPDGRIPMEWLAEMREGLGWRPVFLLPVLESTASILGDSEETDPYGQAGLRVIGVDLLALGNLQDSAARRTSSAAAVTSDNNENGDSGSGQGEAEAASFLDDPRLVLIASELAKNQELTPGDHFEVILNDRVERLHISGTLESGRTGGGAVIPGNLVLFDLPALQYLLGQEDRVDRVEVFLDPAFRSQATLASVRELLESRSGERWQVLGPEVEAENGEQMTAAFRLNLTVLSLIALLVGVYLVGQAMDAAVVRRRQEIGILRSLGLTPAMIRRQWMLEIAVLGFAGSLLGVFLAALVAPFAVHAVSRTVNAIYGGSLATEAGLTWQDLGVGLVLGLTASAISGWIPTRDAARTPPAQVMRSGSLTMGLALLRNHAVGWICIAAGVVVQSLPPLTLAGGARFPLAGYLAAILWLAGGTILCGSLIRWCGRSLLWRRNSAPWSVAGARLRQPSSRHRLAAAGLFVAVAMAAAMSFLIGSFEQTMKSWISQRFRADVYAISAGVQHAGAENRIRAATWQAIESMPGVAEVDPGFMLEIELSGLTTFLASSDLSLLGERQFLAWMEGPLPLEKMPADADAWAVANESFAARFDAAPGDILDVFAGGQDRRIWIRGIDADYGNERGRLLVDRTRLSGWLATDEATSLSVYLAPGEDIDRFVAELQERFPGLRVRSNSNLRATILEIFEQTFAVTRVLKWIGLVVAVVGLGLGLASILRESRDQLWTLRSLGMTRHEIGCTTALESLGIAGGGLTGGLLASLGLGYLLIYVVNRQSFGWTLQFAVPGWELVGLSACVLSLALGLGYLQGRWAWKLEKGEHE